jgi:hypothetical protein
MNYIIEYNLLKGEYPIKEGIIKVKNKQNELEAKIKLEIFLKKSYDFDRMIVNNCTPDTLGLFDDLFGGFNSNPFR